MGKKAPKVKETESEKTAAQVAKKQYDFARSLDFVRDEYESRIKQLDSISAERGITGKANLGAQQVAGHLNEQANTAMQQQGIDPSSGKALSAQQQITDISGDATGRAQAEAAFAQKSAALEGMNNRIAMALGEKTQAVAGLQDIAAGSQQLAAQRAANKLGNKQALMGAVGTAAGFGASGLANGDFSNPFAKKQPGSSASDYVGLKDWKIGDN